MSAGWIKLYRKLSDHPDYFGEAFTRMHAWIDLLLMANYRDGFIRVRGIKVPVSRGQVATSSLSLSKRWMWSRGKVQRYLNELESSGQISQQTNNVITLISISKYDSYQVDDTTDDDADEYADETPSGQQTDTSKEYKEEREEKIIYTHTVEDSKGGAGGNARVATDSEEPIEEAAELLEWIARTYPELAAKKHPLTTQQILWLLRKHTAEDIRLVVAQVADNKRTTEKENVYCRVVTFFRYYQGEPGAPNVPKKQYSWDEVLSAVHRQEVKSTDAFVRVEDNGKVYWIKNR